MSCRPGWALTVVTAWTLATGLTAAWSRAAQTTTDHPSISGDQPAETTSLLGQPLLRPSLDRERSAQLEQDLAAAESALAAEPGNPDLLIWVGRRQAYLGRYRDSIATFTRGEAQFPADARCLRHRGHRRITLRELDKAVQDLTAASRMIEGRDDEIESDGQPNAAGIPTSTLHTNIWYHLGLSHFLRGEFDAACDAYAKCRAACTNNDMLYATLAWEYLALRRAGHDEKAADLLQPVEPAVELLENGDYRDCLLLYRGDLTVEAFLAAAGDADDRPLTDATRGFALAQFLLLQGKTTEATRQLETVISGPQWAAFGFIAAEAELARMKR